MLKDWCSCFGGEDEEDDQLLADSTTCKVGYTSKKLSITSNDDNSHSICGNGIVLGSCALDCDSAYWEVKIKSNAKSVRIGLVRYDPKNKGSPPKDLDYKMDLNHKDTKENLKAGDVVGIKWDQTDMPMVVFTINGKIINHAIITRIRPSINIYPAVLLEDGGECDLLFARSLFRFKPESPKFDQIICAKSII